MSLSSYDKNNERLLINTISFFMDAFCIQRTTYIT
jgi:hypothetical protein